VIIFVSNAAQLEKTFLGTLIKKAHFAEATAMYKKFVKK